MKKEIKRQLKSFSIAELKMLEILINQELDKRYWSDIPRFLTLGVTIEYLLKNPSKKKQKLVEKLNKGYAEQLEKIRKKYSKIGG